MPPRPSTATRLALLGCALAGASALVLCACGGGSSATAENTPGAQSGERAKTPIVSAQPCPAKVNAFVASLTKLRRELAVGLSYDQYAAKVKVLRAAYDAIPVDHLALGCLVTTATPAERAFNKYVDAANTWGGCLADAACTTATIEPVLQRKWRVASRHLASTR